MIAASGQPKEGGGYEKQKRKRDKQTIRNFQPSSEDGPELASLIAQGNRI